MDKRWFKFGGEKESTSQEPEKKDPETSEELPKIQPEFVTKEEFSSLSGKIDLLATSLTNLPQKPAVSPEDGVPKKPDLPIIQEIKDEEVDAAWAAADASNEAVDIAKARRLQGKQYEAKLEQYDRTQNERFENLQAQGIGMIGQINTRMTKESLKTMPYYSYVSKQIEDQIGALPAEQRTPELAQWFYDAAVGKNIDEITARESERKAREKAKTVLPEESNMNGRTQPKDHVTTFAGVFGTEIADADAMWPAGGLLWQKNHDTPDRFAKNLGYRDADHYAKVSQFIMATEPCPDCFRDILPNDEHTCEVRSGSGLINFPPELR